MKGEAADLEKQRFHGASVSVEGYGFARTLLVLPHNACADRLPDGPSCGAIFVNPPGRKRSKGRGALAGMRGVAYFLVPGGLHAGVGHIRIRSGEAVLTKRTIECLAQPADHVTRDDGDDRA